VPALARPFLGPSELGQWANSGHEKSPAGAGLSFGRKPRRDAQAAMYAHGPESFSGVPLWLSR
jgi:hypothetical protein